jgi:hypothetical protein
MSLRLRWLSLRNASRCSGERRLSARRSSA